MDGAMSEAVTMRSGSEIKKPGVDTYLSAAILNERRITRKDRKGAAAQNTRKKAAWERNGCPRLV
jgi:hypothetical protein